MPAIGRNGRRDKARRHIDLVTGAAPHNRLCFDRLGLYSGRNRYFSDHQHFNLKAGASLSLPWATVTVGTPTAAAYVTGAAGGQLNLKLATTNEAESNTLYWADHQPLPITSKPVFATRLSIVPDATGATGELTAGTIVFGLASAYNATFDSVATSAWFKIAALGTGSGYLTNGTQASGATAIAANTGSGTIVVGDRVKFASGATGYYRVTSALSAGSFSVTPAINGAVSGGVAITVVARSVFIETDDATTDVTSDTLTNWTNSTFTDYQIDASDLTNVKFYINDVLVNKRAMPMLLATGNLQPFIGVQKTAVANSDHSILIDDVYTNVPITTPTGF